MFADELILSDRLDIAHVRDDKIIKRNFNLIKFINNIFIGKKPMIIMNYWNLVLFEDFPTLRELWKFKNDPIL